jgi:hypothetical protein
VPQHLARLVAPLVVDFIAYAVHPGASTHRAARRRLLRLVQARRRLHRLRRASRCLSTSRGSSSATSPRAGSPSTTLPRAGSYVTRPGASAPRAARCRLLRAPRLRLAATVALLQPRRAPGCLGTSRGSSSTTSRHAGSSSTSSPLRRAPECLGTSRGSSSTTSPRASSSSTTLPTPRVRVPRHIVRLVSPLVIDYSVRRDYLSRGNTSSTSSTPRAAATSSSGRIASTIHLN